MVSSVQNLQLTNTVAIPRQNKVEKLSSFDNTELQQDTFEKSDKKKNAKKGLIIAGITAAFLIGATIINKHNKAKQIRQIPEELRAIFKELQGEDGETFVNKAYAKLKTYMKLDGLAPDKIQHAGADKSCLAVQGGYYSILNTIGYTDGFFNKIDKATQFSLLAHELKHAEQTTKILRAGLLPEYARAWAEQSLHTTLSDPLNIDFKRAYNKAIKQGKGEEFIENSLQEATDTVVSLMTENHERTLNLPKYSKGSTEYTEAKKYVEATRNYTNLDELGLGTDEYRNNLLEQEAYDFGDKMEKYFKDFFS